MANFKMELPNNLIKTFEEIADNTEIMLKDMTNAGADVVYENVRTNMKKAFKTTRSLEKGLKKTRPYKTPSDDGINTKVGFYGYDTESKPTKKYPQGVPIPLIAMAREYGTSRGERKVLFFRKSFRTKDAITKAMLEVQGRYIKDE